MCCSTKRKIADCVKQLMRKKEIRKITVQDIMDETSMSRQSFYYHFKDIYDVIEWIGIHDFADRIKGYDGQNPTEWFSQLFDIVELERPFLERVVTEVEWPKILPIMKEPVREQLCKVLCNNYADYSSSDTFSTSLDILTNSYCYYLMDYVYQSKHHSFSGSSDVIAALTAITEYHPELGKSQPRMVC